MAQIVRMPDGQQVGFPDDMDPTRIRELILTKYPNAERKAAARTGAQPYQTPTEGIRTQILNAPARMQMGLAGSLQLGGEAYGETVQSLYENPDQFAGQTERPDVFTTLARYDRRSEEGATASDIDARAEEYWQRFQNPEERDALLRELGTAGATTSLVGQLRYQQLASELTPIDVQPGTWGYYAAQAIGATAEMSPALAASVALRNPIPALAWVGIQSGGTAYSQGRAQGLSPEEARSFATLYAIAEGIPEALPLHLIMREGVPIATRIVQGAAAEGIQEGFTEGLQFLIDKGYLDPDMTWGDALPRIRDASMIGVLAGAFMGGGVAVIEPGVNAAGQAATDVSRQVFDTLNQRRQAILDGSFDAIAELEGPLQGSTLQERIEAFAEVQRIYDEAQRGEITPGVDATLEGAVGEAVTPEAIAPDTQTSTPDTLLAQVFDTFGRDLPIISAVRSPEHNAEVGGADQSRHLEEYGGDARDIDVSSLSQQERIDLIDRLSAAGFTGIGVYSNSLHVDLGPRRSWGPSYGSESVPEWAQAAIDRHMLRSTPAIGGATSVATAAGTSLPTGAVAETDTQTGAFPPGEEVVVDQTPDSQVAAAPEAPQQLSTAPLEIYTPSGELVAEVPPIIDASAFETYVAESSTPQEANAQLTRDIQTAVENGVRAALVSDAGRVEIAKVDSGRLLTEDGTPIDLKALAGPGARIEFTQPEPQPGTQTPVQARSAQAPSSQEEAGSQQPVAAVDNERAFASPEPEQPQRPRLKRGGGSQTVRLGNTTIDLGVSKDGETAEIILVKTPPSKQRQGSARAAMSRLLQEFDTSGTTVFLTPEKMGSGANAAALKRFYKSLGFRDNKGSKKDFRSRASMVRDPKPVDRTLASRSASSAQTQTEPRQAGTRPARQDEGQSATRSEIDTQARTEAEPESWTDLAKRQDKLAYTPAKGHIQTFRERGMPQRPPDAIIPLTGGNIKLSDTPTRRDLPRKKLLAIIGDRLYQQRVKSRKMAGFYREKNSEVRVKRFDDIEIMAHEAAHFLDFDKSMKGIFTKLRKAGKGEINDLSYTTERGLVNIEGFAEYVRLWVTDYGQAKSAAPKFTKAFEKAINDAGIGRKMRAFQKASHRWYWQGELAQFRGKSGESSNFFDNFNAFMRSRPGSLFLQGFVDPHYAKKVIERETTGTVTDATRSAWKLGRMTAGSASMTEAVIRYGTPQIAEDGSYEFRGKSLEDVFMPVTKKKDGAERFDRLMEYFKARRASELSQQGRENLFTEKEIAAGLAYADQYPEFADVFEGWKTFNSEMLDFYVSMDLITPEQREAFEANNTEYVPFHRVLDKIGETDAGAPKDIDKRLYGGEQNTREIAQNIVDGLSSNIHAALVSRAKSQLFRNIRSSQKGSEFAVKIGPGSKPLTVALEAYKSRFAEILTSLGYPIEMNGQVFRPPGTPSQMAPVNVDDVHKLLDAHPELLQFWMHNQKPTTTETHVEPVIIEGELQWFEVNSPLLYRDLTAMRAATDVIRVLSFPKRMLTKTITSMPQFMGPNIVRDTLNAGALTQSKFRPLADSLKGMKSYIRSDERFKTFALNGGLFSGRIDADGNIVGDKATARAKAQLQQLGVPPKNLFDQTGRALSSVSRFAVPFEMGTRLGQFERAVDNKVNPLEASFQGREISTDFAQMGRNETWRAFLQITPFANAGLQGIDQMTRHLLESNGKVRPNLKSARKFGVQAFTRLGVTMSAATALLWLINNDDDRYKGLTVDQKARYWHVWLPTGDHIQIPKPYGVGFIFADLPEIALDYISKRLDDDQGNDAAALEDAKRQMAFGLAQHFWFMDYPAVLQPVIEAMQNKKFTGAPIVPQSLQDVEPAYQFNDRTPEIYRAMGRTLGISPLVAEHYMRGFFGYVEAYMVDATDAFLWNEEAWGERPFSRDVLDYFTWQFNGQEIPYRTKWTEGYYELRQRTRTAAATYSYLFKQSPRSLDEFTEFTEREINLRLRELNTIFNRIDRAFSQGNTYLMSIKYNSDLSREVKEERMELWYKRRNDQLADSYERAEEIIREFEEDQQP